MAIGPSQLPVFFSNRDALSGLFRPEVPEGLVVKVDAEKRTIHRPCGDERRQTEVFDSNRSKPGLTPITVAQTSPHAKAKPIAQYIGGQTKTGM